MWTADAEQVLPALDVRRAEWRKKRETGAVALDALMPIHGELEEHWKYYVPQPIPDDAVEKAPKSVREVKILDPACGSGHFLVIAFDLLAALYREEARHEGRDSSDREIAESILENNLFGIDIDARAIQIAAAGLLVKAKLLSPEVHPKRLNLVAPALQLGSLPDEDPSLVQLRSELTRDVGIPPELTRQIVKALAGVDHLGSLLKVDAAVEDAIRQAEVEFERSGGQGDLFGGYQPQQAKLTLSETKASVLDKLEQFLAKHSRSEDLGLRLGGEQLAAGVRFVRMAKEGTYDIVVGNPPYQGTTKMADAGYVASHYPKGKADLYAAFLERGPELAVAGGLTALVTMRGWMFLHQFSGLRMRLLHERDIRVIADLGTGAFSSRSMDDVISSAMVVVRTGAAGAAGAVALQAAPLSDPTRDSGKPARRRDALLAQVGRYEFDPRGFEVIEDEPIVYWWRKEFLAKYAAAPKLGASSPAKFGLNTGNNVRFLRSPWELARTAVAAARPDEPALPIDAVGWSRFMKGAAGRAWIDPCDGAIQWSRNGLEVKVLAEQLYGSYSRQIRNERVYWEPGVAFTMIGSAFSARAHRFRCVIDSKGSSVYPTPPLTTGECLCLMNRREAREVLSSLNPTISFQVGDVNRLPVFPVANADTVLATLWSAFGEHERIRETSVEFRRPGTSPWRYAQGWAQRAVDRPEGGPLPPYEPGQDPPEPTAFVAFAVGIAMGRFDLDGAGILDAAPDTALPHGLLFVSATPHPDSLAHPAGKPLVEAWVEHGPSVGGKHADLGEFLRRGFFNEVHRPMYENRPIYLPLSSSKRNFVAYASVHRFMPTWDEVGRSGLTWDEGERRDHAWDSLGDTALHALLAEHLIPERRHLEGELEDLRKARSEVGRKGAAEKRFADVQKLLEELNEFIDAVTQIAERGPPPPDDKTPAREVDARFAMNLDDGVMVNSAALWPLLEPQWKDPKKWWKELATARGRKDYDWSHLAERYFPARVAGKCLQDPSIAVAHRRFWKLWPEKAYAWELRLQDEIRPDFTINEPDSDGARAKFLADQPIRAAELTAAEEKRRERKAAKADADSEGPLFDGTSEDGSPDEATEDESDE